MKDKLKQYELFNQTWLGFSIVILLVLGVLFRFVNIDTKVYWHDEVFTSLRVSGYTVAEFNREVFDRDPIEIADLQKYQRPNGEKGLVDTIKGLALEEPQLPPLYFLMVRFWTQLFGSSVAVTRIFSAIVSLLSFPCIYWLCRELFRSPLVGWMAIALIAVSPLHVLYAQEARMYSLWIVTILLSSAALLRATRIKTKFSWVIYAVTLLVSFYIYIFSILVAISHGIYVLLIETNRFSKTVINYFLSIVIALLAFAPWAAIIITKTSVVNRATRSNLHHISLLSLIDFWLRNLSYAFWDIKSNHVLELQSIRNNLLTYIFLPLFVLLAAYALYFLYRNTTKTVWLFIFTLTGVTALSLMLPDLILGGQRSVVPRYLFPCYLGVHLAVAYLLTTKITSLLVNTQQQKLWKIITIALLSGGVISCTISSQTNTWWHKYVNYYTPQVAQIINQANRPLTISDTSMGNVLSISYLLEPKGKIQLIAKQDKIKIPNGFSDVFFFNPFNFSRKWRSELEKEYDIEMIHKQGKLWRLTKKTEPST